MTLQQFEYIVALEKFRHFTKAAEYCNVTQPTLSAMIQKLEEELEKTSQLIQELTGQRPAVFRPPFGAYNDRCIEQIPATLFSYSRS